LVWEVLGWGYGLSYAHGAGSMVYGCGFCGAAAENSTMDDVDDKIIKNYFGSGAGMGMLLG